MIAFSGEIDCKCSDAAETRAAEAFLHALAAHDFAEEMQGYVDKLIQAVQTPEELALLVCLRRNIACSHDRLRMKVVELYGILLLLCEGRVLQE